MEGRVVAEKKDIRVRFAPSPTGNLNIGTARTAFLNWLFARHNNGAFILRIEDTDKERSKKKYEKNIEEGLKWLGLEWDEKYRQSDRIERYKHFLGELMDKKAAYYCFCTEGELELERQAQLSQGLPPKYSGKCRLLSDPEINKMRKKKNSVIRFKMPEKKVTFQDDIRGKVTFDTSLIGDIVIAKSTNEPLYNFAVVIDDHEMNISHVIRGEDHISNTPKQIAIQEALGFPQPIYVHLPLILGPDRKKLSKRYLAESITSFRDKGYLPSAFLNFLVLLGWHPKEDREILSVSEMINEFGFERVQKGGAIFNPEKLDWLNSYYIRKMDEEELLAAISPFVPREWLESREYLIKVIRVERERIKRLFDFTGVAGFFFELPNYDWKLLIWKQAEKRTISDNLEASLRELNQISEDFFDEKEVEAKLRPVIEERGTGEVLWPLRVALSGQTASPGPFELAGILGKKETKKRIKEAIGKLNT